MLAPRLHRALLADHPSHRLPVRRHAPSKGSSHHDLSVTVLRMCMRYSVLGLRVLAVYVANHEPDTGKPVLGWIPQRVGSAVLG